MSSGSAKSGTKEVITKKYAVQDRLLCGHWKAFITGYHNRRRPAMPTIVFNVADRPELLSGKWFRRHHVRVMPSVMIDRMAMRWPARN